MLLNSMIDKINMNQHDCNKNIGFMSLNHQFRKRCCDKVLPYYFDKGKSSTRCICLNLRFTQTNKLYNFTSWLFYDLYENPATKLSAKHYLNPIAIIRVGTRLATHKGEASRGITRAINNATPCCGKVA